jgi:hypothetical protein
MAVRLNVGVLIFDDVEVLDVAGPYEVFSRTRLQPGVDSRRADDSAPFRVFTVAESTEPVAATGGLTVVPRFSFREGSPHRPSRRSRRVWHPAAAGRSRHAGLVTPRRGRRPARHLGVHGRAPPRQERAARRQAGHHALGGA